MQAALTRTPVHGLSPVIKKSVLERPRLLNRSPPRGRTAKRDAVIVNEIRRRSEQSNI